MTKIVLLVKNSFVKKSMRTRSWFWSATWTSDVSNPRGKPLFRNENLEHIFNIYSREVLIERDESQVHFRIDEEALG